MVGRGEFPFPVDEEDATDGGEWGSLRGDGGEERLEG